MQRFKFGICIALSILVTFSIYNIFIKNSDVTVYGYIKYADGLGRQSVDLINMLESNKIDVNFIGAVLSKEDLSPTVKSVLRKLNFKIGKVLINEQPLNLFGKEKYAFDSLFFKLFQSINQIARSKQIWLSYSMFESDKISSLWVEELNNKYDAAILPDESLVSIYQNAGVKIPLFVVPLSVDFSQALTQPIKTDVHPVFTFANFSTIEDRKNIIKLLQAFKQAFAGRSDVRLLLSARKSETSYREKVVEYIMENNLTNVDYSILEKDATLYNQYFNQADCYVSLSKGEGFSVQPREAMARGIPVIVSDSLAQKTIADSGFVRVVPAVLPKLATYFDNTLVLGNNFDVETKAAAEALLDVYNNYSKYLALGANARQWVKKYSYENIKPLYMNLVKPKKIILGKVNKVTEDYLETTSEELYNKYVNLVR